MGNRISLGGILVIIAVLLLLFGSCTCGRETYSSSASSSGRRTYRPVATYKAATPKPTTAAKTTRKPKATSKPKDDPYNASDYAHADDFYYDHWDDFVDFEEAEDYYDEHS